MDYIEFHPDFKRLINASKLAMELLTPVERRLTRVAALTRSIARRSMRPVARKPKQFKDSAALRRWRERWRKKVRTAPPAPPGSPPRSRQGALRELLFFAVKRLGHKLSWVVGPMVFSRSGRGTVPALHEYGGSYRIYVRVPGRKERKPVVVRYPARPYMAPALREALRIVTSQPGRTQIQVVSAA